MSVDSYITLPVAGKRLVRFRFDGNPKDSLAAIEVEGAPELRVPLYRACIDMELTGPVMLKPRAEDDRDLQIEIAPLPQQEVLVEKAEIEIDRTDLDALEALRSELESFATAKGVAALELDAATYNLRLRLSTMPR